MNCGTLEERLQPRWPKARCFHLSRVCLVPTRSLRQPVKACRAYRNPGIGAHLIAVFIPIVPRIGPLAYLAIKDPKAETEQFYVASVNRSVDFYRRRLEQFREDRTASVDLPNRDLDTGEVVKPGAYRLTDQTYAKLLQRITARPERAVRPGIKRDILAYYADPNAPIVTKRHKRAWKRVLAGLQELKQMPVATPASIEERASIDPGQQ